METSHSDDTIRIRPDPTTDETAAIVAAIAKHRETPTSAPDTRNDVWTLTGRIANQGGAWAATSRDVPDDPWVATSRIQR